MRREIWGGGKRQEGEKDDDRKRTRIGRTRFQIRLLVGHPGFQIGAAVGEGDKGKKNSIGEQRPRVQVAP